MKHFYKTIESPVGPLTLLANQKSLLAVLWEDDDPRLVKIQEKEKAPEHPVLLETEKQLKEYFSGKRKVFDLPLEFQGTDFQKSVWKSLTKIPFGKTSSYSELAMKIASPKASRAVGAANGKNPISIIVPCHRVIGKNGSLTGFAGGLKMKSFLLGLEAKEL